MTEVPDQIKKIVAWGWEHNLSSLWQTLAPVRGMPRYRIIFGTSRKKGDDLDLTTDDPAHYTVGPLIRLIDQAYCETGYEIKHLSWIPAKNKIMLWYVQQGKQNYVSYIDPR